jgi:hypothetical protein
LLQGLTKDHHFSCEISGYVAVRCIKHPTSVKVTATATPEYD